MKQKKQRSPRSAGKGQPAVLHPFESARDEYWMHRALALARHGEGLTRPNPPVGAVVVKNDHLVGQGFHHQAGGAHAEVFALNDAAEKAEGATLYVTLEPCSTWGRTPPCTEKIMASGVRRVVVSVPDPNPKHAGKGLSLLRRKGIAVDVGVCREAGEHLIAPFARWITSGRPYVTLKLAVSLDGRIADREGQSRWITGPAARAQVHHLRRQADAILVGSRTARRDDPSLLPEPSEDRRPFRIVLDSRGALPLSAKVLNDGKADQTVIATTRRCPAKRQAQLRAKGAEVWLLPSVRGGVDIVGLLEHCGKRGFLHLLCEGGGELAAALIQTQQVDEFVIFVAPRIVGGAHARPAVGGAGWSLADAPKLEFLETRRIGPDLLVRARPLVRAAR